MKSTLKLQFFLLILGLMLAAKVFAQVPQLINYQGLLVDPVTGKPKPNGTYKMAFAIYNTASGGRAIWTETQNVQTNKGLYNVMLGSVTPLTAAILSGPEKYLGIKVEADAEMTPRKRIVSVAYAIISGEADKLDGKDAADFAAKAELSTSDHTPPNEGSNLVNWNNLQDVPLGFADGVDDGESGGGNTLDQAYDQGGPGAGRTINADAGAVNIAGPNGLTVNGKVGVGTGSPNQKLEINGGNQEVGMRIAWGSQFPALYGEIKRAQSGGLIINSNAGGTWADINFQTEGQTRLFVQSDGKVGIGTTTPTERLEVNGNAKVKVLQITGGADLSEQFEVQGAPNSGGDELRAEPGMVVCIDPQHPGKLLVSSRTYDRTVAGIISGAGGVKPGMLMGQDHSIAQGSTPVALSGRVYCYAEASNGAINPGDLLTTSGAAGHAMKVTDYAKAQGAIIGKAMSSLKEGKGMVLVLVSLQ
ncbi:MAG: hypothetical protein ACREOI_24750 [bacterium]